ncbi:MAG TPA: prolyl oligopeptidase family serine peptidase [Xanthobacteraceae bacterium]|nr:prolyl oligopeptidase family serine peptidase [Xanthobacteraceae bacterium]
MLAGRILLAIGLGLAATCAHAAGFRFIEVPADTEGPALAGAIWYPCAAPPGEVKLARRTIPAVKDCPIEGERLPLVVISHGRIGSFAGHHDTAEALADAGFMVAAIDHPGDSSGDKSRSWELSVMIERPAAIKRLIDFMLGASPAAGKIDAQRIGLFGFSRGGYTGLVAVGAEPHFAIALPRCAGASLPICEDIRNKRYPPSLVHDARIKAAVIADPLPIFFDRDSLAGVKVPIDLWASQTGGDGVEPHDVAALEQSLPAGHAYHVVANAGHFAFLAPCPPAAARENAEPCVDAPGFDRVAFHAQLNAAMVAFFRQQLGP